MARHAKQQTQHHGKLTFGSCTNVGCVRDHNEDNLIVCAPLFAVADGMGGHAAGEVASELAVQVLRSRAPRTADARSLGRAIEDANLEIIKAAQEGQGREGMGTTMTAAILENERLVIGQVGDSRAYLYSQGTLHQLTRDHSLMADLIESGQITPEEARIHPNRSVITRALGSSIYTQPDLYELNIQEGDRLLLCSDGLSSIASEQTIASTLAQISDPQACAQQLVQDALDAGGQDNVTVIVIDIDMSTSRHAFAQKKSHRLAAAIAIAFVLLLAGTGFGVSAWIQGSAYLADYNGKVAIYKGINSEIFGKRLDELERVTNVNTDDLAPGVASRLSDDGIKVDSLEDAEKLVKTYENEIAKKQGSPSSTNSASSTSTSSTDASNTTADAQSAKDAS